IARTRELEPADDRARARGDEGHEGRIVAVVDRDEEVIARVVRQLIGALPATGGDARDDLLRLQVHGLDGAVAVTRPELVRSDGDDAIRSRGIGASGGVGACEAGGPAEEAPGAVEEIEPDEGTRAQRAGHDANAQVR